MKHATSRVLYEYWNRVRSGRSAPERNEMKPEAIRTILGDIFILDVSGAIPYTVRLAGTQICSLLGRELRGRNFVEAFAPEEHTETYSLLDSAVRTTTPVIAGIIGETEDRRMLGLELLLLPLRHHGRTDARLMGSLAALSRPYWSTLVPLVSLRIGSSRFIQAGSPANGLRLPLQLHVIQGSRF